MHRCDTLLLGSRSCLCVDRFGDHILMQQQRGIGQINQRYLTIGLAATAAVGAGALLYYNASRWGLTRSRVVSSLVRQGVKGAPEGRLTLEPSQYPKVRRGDVVETLHGQTVPDPYRWLEDPDSKETQAFVEAQNRLTQGLFSQCKSRSQFKDLFRQLYDYEKFGCPSKHGSRYYHSHNTGLQAQNVVYSQASLDSEPVKLLDPNTLSKDGTVALGGMKYSEDGALLAYQLSSGGSDWRTMHVLKIDAASGQPTKLEDELRHVKFSDIAWTHDSKGFFYNRYPAPEARGGELGTETDINENQELWYHVVGTPQSEDPFVAHIPEHPQWQLGADVTDDGRYLIVSVRNGCEPTNRLWYVDLERIPRHKDSGALDLGAYDLNRGETGKLLPLVKLVDTFEAQWEVVANEGPVFTLLTNHSAPRYRIVQGNIMTKMAPSAWKDIVPQHDKDLLQWATALKGDAMVVCYLHDVRSILQLRSLKKGSLTRDLPLPGLGSVRSFSGRRQDTEIFFSYTDFATPGANYRLDVADPSAKPSVVKESKLKGDVNLRELETKQEFVTSKDGTRVPMFIICKKGITLDGSNPTLLYGYGGFNISLEPGFSVARLCFILAYGGVVAVANLRGGGEYGIDWRNAGSLHRKQNVFDDFAACAEHLISSQHTSPGKLIIQGGSNGGAGSFLDRLWALNNTSFCAGLLVAASANQRPDLFACIIGQVGVMDMLRFHKFTIGHAWVSDYGSPDKADDFAVLHQYSPLHNVQPPGAGSRQYPAVILTTGDHDDRVVPLHTHKLLATLQHTLASCPDSPQRNPLVSRIETRAGHGAGKPTEMVISEVSDCFAFAAEVVGANFQL